MKIASALFKLSLKMDFTPVHRVPVRQKNAQSRPDPLADKSISITRRYKRKVERMSSLALLGSISYPNPWPICQIEKIASIYSNLRKQ